MSAPSVYNAPFADTVQNVAALNFLLSCIQAEIADGNELLSEDIEITIKAKDLVIMKFPLRTCWLSIHYVATFFPSIHIVEFPEMYTLVYDEDDDFPKGIEEDVRGYRAVLTVRLSNFLKEAHAAKQGEVLLSSTGVRIIHGDFKYEDRTIFYKNKELKTKKLTKQGVSIFEHLMQYYKKPQDISDIADAIISNHSKAKNRKKNTQKAISALHTVLQGVCKKKVIFVIEDGYFLDFDKTVRK